MDRSLTSSRTELAAPMKHAPMIKTRSRDSGSPVVPASPATPSGDASARQVLGVVRRALEVPGPVPVRLGVEGLEDLGPVGLPEVAEALGGRPVVGHPATRDQDEQAGR